MTRNKILNACREKPALLAFAIGTPIALLCNHNGGWGLATLAVIVGTLYLGLLAIGEAKK